MMNYTIRAMLIFSTFVAAYLYQQFWRATASPSLTESLGELEDSLPIGTPSLYAIADIHGDYERAHAALMHARVVDGDGNWIAGNATLVQTGDIVDRGPDTRRLYTWMRNLTIQAESHGGSVKHLYGNHEYMNAMHDWRYVVDGDLASFPEPQEQNRLKAFSTHGSIGSDWLIDYKITYRSSIYRAHFMHAGFNAEHVLLDTEEIGAEFMRDLLNGKRYQYQWTEEQQSFWEGDGPMWYRGYAALEEEEACQMASHVMAVLDVDFLVMGHTPQFGGALSRCGGRILLIDTGLSSAYEGRPVVLEFLRSKSGLRQAKLWYEDDETSELVYPEWWLK